jgi:excisionase family DNA binding protein
VQKVDEYVKIAEAAKYLGVAENTLRSWSDAGKVRAVRNPANGYRLFCRKDLDAFLKKLSLGELPRRPK